jgi:Fe-S cluster biogenesis protein NfuA
MNPLELRERTQQILREEVAPALELDGTGLEVLDVTDGVARVRLSGACAGCPATIHILIHGIEQELRSRLPEIEYLEAVP